MNDLNTSKYSLRRYLLCASLLACLPLQTVTASDTPPTTVDVVDIHKYMGKWYEIARLPMFFQRHCAQDVTANYTLQANGKVLVENACVKADYSTMQVAGEAVSTDATNSKLLVTFMPKFLRGLNLGRAPYWILKLDPNYQTALVGNPSRSYLWLLSRTPVISDTTYTAYVEAARQQGFDTTKLLRTKQTVKPEAQY